MPIFALRSDPLAQEHGPRGAHGGVCGRCGLAELIRGSIDRHRPPGVLVNRNWVFACVCWWRVSV